MKKNYKAGDIIYFDRRGDFFIERIKEIVEIDGKVLITPFDWDWLALTEDELLDDDDERVKADKSMRVDKTIRLSEARRWLEINLPNYYESDSWSRFDFEQAVKDFCYSMVY